MRVLQLVSDTDRRGAQVFAVHLDRALREGGIDVSTMALCPGSSANGLVLETLTGSRWWMAGLPALRRRAGGVDVVIAHGSTTLPACAVAVPKATPFLYRSIGDLPRWVGTGFKRRRVAHMLRRAAGVSVLWSDLVPFVTDTMGVADVRVIPNAVAVADFPPRSQRERLAARHQLGLDPSIPVVAHIGSLSPEKRVGLLLDAVAHVGGQLVLTGGGPERFDLEAAAERSGVTATFTGTLADPGVVYAAADVVALASRTEGQPAVLIEAALSARAVVAPRVGGIGELVDDGVTGVLYDGDGDGDDLVAALSTALDRAETLGAAGPGWAGGRFDIDIVASRWLDWLQEFSGS
ncbi:MAG: glycosyltransferase family 4 protein [Acidimicrobiales bacterium]